MGIQCNSVHSSTSPATDGVDRVRTPPPDYDDTSNTPKEEDYVPENRSIFRRICQLFILLLAIAIAVVLTRNYIDGQAKHAPSSPLVTLELVFVILYMAVLGFFLSMVLLNLLHPWMVRLGDYATHKAGWLGKVFAIAGILAIVGVCIVWVIAFPLIPAVGGIIARKSS